MAQRIRVRRLLLTLSVAAVALASASVPAASADAPASELVSVRAVTPRLMNIEVRSAAMGKIIPLSVIVPRDRSVARPTLYLLNGADGGEGGATWVRQTDVVRFFSDKNTNVVIPNSGAGTYYTDWERDDRILGRVKWSTFLGTELPPIIDTALATTRRQAIAGISSSATSVLNLAVDHPGLYAAVGSYSGCAASSSPVGQAYIRLVAEGRGSSTTTMWGPYDGPGWRAHDPLLTAPRLRGTSLYISSATGLPGKYDNPAGVRPGNDLASQIVQGGPIEAATYGCTQKLRERLQKLHIPATYDFPATGTHSWAYWEEQLHRSWPQFARAIGAS